MDEWYIVDARQGRRCVHGRRASGVPEIGAKIDEEFCTQRQDLAVLRERHFCDGGQIAAMHIRQEALGPTASLACARASATTKATRSPTCLTLSAARIV